jgi:hypothetical protein
MRVDEAHLVAVGATSASSCDSVRQHDRQRA